ncbi:VanZ family protein [Mucilaginibacter ximonensis]|uniref:VanZ family protein n=1 Tax=Mucilaginibacter ximonensis TaxID=538021 RepID=A0ABW5YB19_9SPHI
MQRRAFIATFILIVIFIIIQELKFRHYLFEEHSPIAGCLPNFTAALLFIFGYGLIKYPLTMRQTMWSAVFAVMGLVLYEFAQIWMPGRVFDWNDIIASVVGGLVAVGIVYLIKDIH